MLTETYVENALYLWGCLLIILGRSDPMRYENITCWSEDPGEMPVQPNLQHEK